LAYSGLRINWLVVSHFSFLCNHIATKTIRGNHRLPLDTLGKVL